jgi:hypothetical protein
LAAKVTQLIASDFKAHARDRIVAHVRRKLNWETTVSGIEGVYEGALNKERRNGGSGGKN